MKLQFIICSFLVTIGFISIPDIRLPATELRKTEEQNPLLNGRIWRNQYHRTQGSQFLLSEAFIKGSVCFNNNWFDDLELKYDAANDELILKVESYPLIILNKEMVDSFRLHTDRTYTFFNAGNDTTQLLSGYVNILYDGKTPLYSRYFKEIQPLAVDGIFDLFVDEQKLYILKDNKVLTVSGRRKFLDLFGDRRKEIKKYLKVNKVKAEAKHPEGYTAALRFYDNLANNR
ncbi:MAG: hypothetical protein MUD02_08930 [Bacteroidales bacterium]|jgi:hypothetical protein|nr:hypothetical protein [Bacteroidales bacterium]